MNKEGLTKSIDKIFLKYIKIDDFGAFSNRVAGPFNPGFNVVFGNNEAGKTTLSAFVGGVLFGWEDGRSGRNTYRPKNAERSGSLFFQDSVTGEEFEFSRMVNAEGLQGPGQLIDDIDRETFSTMFALTSDELRSLKNTSDVTAKLLTAGSGTSASPAQALKKLQTRIAQYSSKAAEFQHSLVQLGRQKEELRSKIVQASEESERYKKEAREFSELDPQRDEMTRRLESLNAEIENLTAQKARYERLEEHLEKTLERREQLLVEEQELVALHTLHDKNSNNELGSLDHAQEHFLRDKLDTLYESQAKAEHRVSLAKDTYDESRASYEALLETGDMQELEQKERRQREVQIGLSIILPLVFIVAGIPIFMHGRAIASLSFTALGVGLIVFAVLLASAALVMLFKPSKTNEALQTKKNDAHWVMLQDKKKLEACSSDLIEHEVMVQQYLDSSGFKKAHGSLKRARVMLDEAKDERVQSSIFVQKQQALISQLESLEDTLKDIKDQKEYLASALSLKEELSLESIDKLIAEKAKQRAALTETSGNINRRYGELKQELSHAENLTYFDDLKLAYQLVCTREQESAKDLARLLLAKKMLESSIAAWESKSQPEVYKQASRLLSLMTKGKWNQIRMTSEGRLQVVDEVRTVREPLHLSLGTCQQLYLSLRIALLMTAENVGHIIPIMADDILVNFDGERREGAVRALQELAQKRQVIIFTCHQEIVSLMQKIESPPNVVEL